MNNFLWPFKALSNDTPRSQGVDRLILIRGSMLANQKNCEKKLKNIF